jgi:hypothetical protein
MTTLPTAEKLHEMARAGAQPTVFAESRERLAAATDAVAAEREALHTLIRGAYAQGVGPAVLARWSGYDPSRIYQILS